MSRRERVLAALERYPKGLSKARLVYAARISRHSYNALLDEMVADGQITVDVVADDERVTHIVRLADGKMDRQDG